MYVTCNILFDELAEISCLLQDTQCNDDVEFGVMAIRIKDKYDKYWKNIEKINMFIFVTIVLDPRHKLNYVKFALKKMYDGENGEKSCF